MKELTNQQSKVVANKIHEYAEMIINGYGTRTGFEKTLKTLIEL